ncbi:Hsp20/alpha crystallin family protein [Bradyrhizobium sp. sGM-13]|uniref:Hsp20/alpha crystallin family protein n=1 Tax=Bradyrhizobium sp. sGM-13 TaxID=2831781 RepID=UPI001BCEA87C|nr:Hsp20/alpha crystallin family protein [Bradyrhizobium sp. sGM-13]
MRFQAARLGIGHLQEVALSCDNPSRRSKKLKRRPRDNTVRIAGRKSVEYPQQASSQRRERFWGEFDRTIAVPVQIDPDGIKAEYSDGLLDSSSRVLSATSRAPFRSDELGSKMSEKQELKVQQKREVEKQ